jgi:hypothetical protein
VGGDVPIDSETHVVNLSISIPDPPTESFGDTHTDRIYVHTFIGMSICVCM